MSSREELPEYQQDDRLRFAQRMFSKVKDQLGPNRLVLFEDSMKTWAKYGQEAAKALYRERVEATPDRTEAHQLMLDYIYEVIDALTADYSSSNPPGGAGRRRNKVKLHG